jgi:hypothetical protein
MNILIPHLSNANANLSKHTTKIQNATKRAEKITVPTLNITKQIDISFASIGKFLIPEDHIGGRTYNSHFIQIDIDNSAPNISENTIFEMLSHELAHAARWQKNTEYTNTLFDGIINEGLATVFEAEITKNTPSKRLFFLKTIIKRTEKENAHIISLLSTQLNNKYYNYEELFFSGNKKTGIPRWAAYSAGYDLVKKYLNTHNKTISAAIADKYSDFQIPHLNN